MKCNLMQRHEVYMLWFGLVPVVKWYKNMKRRQWFAADSVVIAPYAK